MGLFQFQDQLERQGI